MKKLSLRAADGPQLARWLLRIGLAFSFGYAGVMSVLDPLVWAGFLPHLLTALVPATALLTMFAVYELALALWLLSGRRVRIAALLAAATLAGIILSNASEFIVTFRDVGLLTMALALAALER